MMKANDNRTKITFEFEGKPYTLVFSADSLKKMERNYGVKFAKLDDNILSAAEDLFIGAFIENHNETPLKKRRAIYAAMCGETGEDTLSDVLLEMMQEAFREISPQGNVTWKVERKV